MLIPLHLRLRDMPIGAQKSFAKKKDFKTINPLLGKIQYVSLLLQTRIAVMVLHMEIHTMEHVLTMGAQPIPSQLRKY